MLKKRQMQHQVPLFAGGVLGDDKTVLEKMKYGQVHAAGLTGVGLGECCLRLALWNCLFISETINRSTAFSIS